MAQTNYTPISLYYSTTPAAVPVNTNLVNGELAINIADGKLFYKDSGGVVQLLASKAGASGSVTSVDVSGGTTGLTTSGGPVTTSGTITLAGTLITSNGGTGLSSYTAGDLTYYASGTALSKLAIGTANQVLTSSGTAPQWSSALTVTGLTDSGNLTFTGTGNRITGDFSNATVANRVMFQTSTTNGATAVFVIPNGTSNTSIWEANSDSSGGTNASVLQMGVFGGTDVRLNSNLRGTGTYLPMTFYTGGSEAVRIGSGASDKGTVGIGYTSLTGVGNNGLAVLGNVGIGTTLNNVYDGAAAARPLVVSRSDSNTTLNTSTSAIVVVNPDQTSGNSSQINFATLNSSSSTIQHTAAAISTIYANRSGSGTNQYPSGQLVFSTNPGYLVLNGGPLERMRIDSSGLIGIKGAASTSWASTYQVIQYNAGPALWSANNANINLTSNVYNDGTNRYITTAGAGGVNINTAGASITSYSSGTAGNAVTVGASFNVNLTDCVMTTANGGLGYGTGSGGTVTQATSKSTAVTLNKPSGRITMNGAALAANTTVEFTFNNSLIGGSDMVVINITGNAATAAAYNIGTRGLAAGSIVVGVRNITAGSLSESLELTFALIKGATA